MVKLTQNAQNDCFQNFKKNSHSNLNTVLFTSHATPSHMLKKFSFAPKTKRKGCVGGLTPLREAESRAGRGRC